MKRPDGLEAEPPLTSQAGNPGTAAQQSTAGPAAASPRASMVVPLVVATAFFMENFDATVIATALPSMAVSFGESPIAVSTGVTAYLVSLAIFIPVSGWAADRFGLKRVFRVAIGVFTLASAGCGLAATLPEFIGARVLQGVGGAMMVPVGRLAVLRAVEKRDFVRAMSFVTVPALIGGVIGPPLGGFFATEFTWRLIFFLQVPIGLLGIVLVTIHFAGDDTPDRRPLDWLGFLLTGAAVTCLMLALETLVHGAGITVMNVALLISGLVLGLLALRHARRRTRPLLDVTLLRIATFAKSVGAGTLFTLNAAAVPFLLPLLLQVGFGLSPLTSGLLTFASAAAALVMKGMAPALLRRFGFRTALVANNVVIGVTTLLCALFTEATPLLLIALVLLLYGFARSLQFMALNALSFANVPAAQMSGATSLAGTIRQIGNALGVGGAALLLQLSAGDALAAGDISLALAVVGAVALLSALMFLRLAPDAGAEVSGHASQRQAGAGGPKSS